MKGKILPIVLQCEVLILGKAKKKYSQEIKINEGWGGENFEIAWLCFKFFFFKIFSKFN